MNVHDTITGRREASQLTARAQRPVDHVRPLPASVVERCAATGMPHGRGA